MSVSIERVETLISKYPALADVPVAVVHGTAMSAKDIREVGLMDQVKTKVKQAEQLRVSMGDYWVLTEAYYRQQVEKERMIPGESRVKIVAVQGFSPISSEEALREVQERTRVGSILVDVFKSLHMEVLKRL